MADLTELSKLEKWLKENNIKYQRRETPPFPKEYNPFIDDEDFGARHQLWIADNNGEYLWDAICQYGSYGYEEGLLEIMGVIVDEEKAGDSVEGYLTADEVIERVNAWLRKGNENEIN